MAVMKACPFMYLPTSPERFARPLGNFDDAESSRRCELHVYPDATTNVRARYSIGSAGRSRRTACAATMVEPAASVISFRTSV